MSEYIKINNETLKRTNFSALSNVIKLPGGYLDGFITVEIKYKTVITKIQPIKNSDIFLNYF